MAIRQNPHYERLRALRKLPRKGTPTASPISAQQSGNGAIVERLRSGRSFFGVRARGEGSKGYAEKGAPTKKFPSRTSLAAASTENRSQCERACGNPKWDQNSAGRCPHFRRQFQAPRRSSLLFEVVLPTQILVNPRRSLGHLAHFSQLFSVLPPNPRILRTIKNIDVEPLVLLI